MGSSSSKLVALDFDKTIHPNLTESLNETPVPGGRQFVRQLQREGYEVVIFTHRAVDPEGVEQVTEWLRKHDFPVVPVTAVKPDAIAYIDDRGFRFEGDFDVVMDFLHDRKAALPWTDK